MQDRRLPSTMKPEEIVQEITELQSAMKLSVERTFELSKALYSQTRRKASDNNTSAFVNFANSWSRFSGAVAQGLNRLSSSEKILKRTQEETIRLAKEADEQKVKDEERKKTVQSRKQKQKASLFGDMVELYGEDVVPDAE